jgi:hypothetical protein
VRHRLPPQQLQYALAALLIHELTGKGAAASAKRMTEFAATSRHR